MNRQLVFLGWALGLLPLAASASRPRAASFRLSPDAVGIQSFAAKTCRNGIAVWVQAHGLFVVVPAAALGDDVGSGYELFHLSYPSDEDLNEARRELLATAAANGGELSGTYVDSGYHPRFAVEGSRLELVPVGVAEGPSLPQRVPVREIHCH